MYKWWVQTSMASNMVVVDGKMQEPKECRTLLYHSGPMLNVIAAETDARWSNPPYFGGYAQIEKVKSGDAPYVPVPDSHPNVSDVTDFTEPVRQRRLILVTDDYVLLADDLKSDKPHTFDNLMHLRGATLPSLEGAVHQAQFDVNPLSSGQFITNVNRLAVTAPYRIESVHLIGGTTRLADSFPGEQNQNNWESGGAKSLSEPGELHIDEHILWPAKVEVAIGDYAESWTVSKKLAYDVQGDGKKLASGLFGAWILGSGSIDVDVTGIKTLRLAVNTNRARNTKKTIFWTNAELMTADGKETPLADLAARTREENVSQPPKPGLDYEGGPIRVAGELLSAATALPGEPDDISEPGVITVDLSGLNAVRFKAGIGGDWPVGDEGQLRKTVAIRAQGTSASFLTLLEPFETKRMVKSATAMDAGHVHVELNDGRVQEITISKLDSDDGVVAVDLRETVNGKPVRQESASGSDR
jgi:hypothetical protein